MGAYTWSRGSHTTVLALLCVFGVGGCTRNFWRRDADQEAANVLAEKDQYEQWKIEQFHVYPDPRSRFADHTNPDRPPMPPDDPAAYDLAPRSQRPGKAGVARIEGTGYLDLLAHWDSLNRAEVRLDKTKEEEKKIEIKLEEQPAGTERLPPPKVDSEATSKPEEKKDETLPSYSQALAGPRKPFLIKVEQAVELGLINSREFQDRREDLFLTALPVTFERFGFAAQWLYTQEAIRERIGRNFAGGPSNRWALNGSTGFNKLFSTGALLLFRFANQTVIELTGKDRRHTTSVSTINLDLVQPLLREGGKAVTLEPLTQAERNLLYEIRSYARFRKEFFVALAAGGDIFSTRFGAIRLPASGSAVTEGYLPTLLRAAQLNNERANADALQKYLRQLDALKEGGDIAQINVDQVEQNLLDSRALIIQQEALLRDGLDRFKLQLGIPVNVEIELDESPVRPLEQHIQKHQLIIDQFDQARRKVSQTVDQAGLPPKQVRSVLRRYFTESPLVEGTQFRTALPARWAEWERRTEAQIKEVRDVLLAEKNKLLDQKTDLQLQNRDLSPADDARLRQLDAELDLSRFEQVLREYESEAWRRLPQPERARALLIRDLLNSFEVVLGEARMERLQLLRRSWPELPAVRLQDFDLMTGDLDEVLARAAQYAIINRFDLMNERAAVVDAWRQIAVQANALLGVFNVTYHLDASTPPGLAQPLRFMGSRTRHQLILDAQAPFIRKLERNNYRAALIAFQRARRSLMAAEDEIVNSVRQEIRQLRVLYQQYTIQKRALELAYLQVEQALDNFNRPPQPTGAGVGAGPGGGLSAGEAASLTQQLLQAQSRLPRAQNQLYSLWINYLTNRMALYRDLELMPLDPRGVWTDELATHQPPERGRSSDHALSDLPGQRPDAGAEVGQPAERLPDPTRTRPE